MGKQCKSCGRIKEIIDFHLDKNSSDGHVTLCKPCANARSNTWVKRNLADVVARKKERRKDVKKSLLEAAQNRARVKTLPIDITLEDIIVPSHCPILGIELIKSEIKASDGSPSLDRIIPDKGYVKGNIQVISRKANIMKSNATFLELLSFAKWVSENIKEDQCQ